jgi:heme-degrading monooxygenase HmoA
VFARVSTYRGDPAKIDEGLDRVQKDIIPRVQQLDGFKGFHYLVDRESGKALSVVFYETEEALRASEEAANRLRSEAADTTGATVDSVERYEVAISS